MRNLIVILAIAIGFSACKKEAGEGGSSVIKGKVYKIYTYQTPQGQIDTLYYQLDVGKDIFIIYSDDENDIYDDSFDTHWNGEYRFEFLRKGNYSLAHAKNILINTNILLVEILDTKKGFEKSRKSKI